MMFVILHNHTHAGIAYLSSVSCSILPLARTNVNRPEQPELGSSQQNDAGNAADWWCELICNDDTKAKQNQRPNMKVINSQRNAMRRLLSRKIKQHAEVCIKNNKRITKKTGSELYVGFRFIHSPYVGIRV